MEVRAKKALGQHFLTDLSIAQRIAEALLVPCPATLTVPKSGQEDAVGASAVMPT